MMYLFSTSGDVVIDFDLDLLSGLLTTVEAQWQDVLLAIKQSQDPDQFGYWDDAEYLAGLAFVAAQRYVSTTYPSRNITKREALAIPPHLSTKQPCVALINAAANFWKHVGEWSDPPSHQQQSTAHTIESFGIKACGYVCTNALELIAGRNPHPFTHMKERLLEWRCHLIGMRTTR